MYQAGLNVVFRDCLGKVKLAAASGLAESFSPLVLEAFALKRGLELALEAGFSRILVESDSSTLVKAVNSVTFPLSKVGNIIMDIVSLIRNLGVLSVIFVPRKANRIADALAKFGINLFSESIWLEDVPLFVLFLVAEDSSSPL
ncbi:hypothetical protein ACOSP7_028979 [Xanthoceras sorbifolium]